MSLQGNPFYEKLKNLTNSKRSRIFIFLIAAFFLSALFTFISYPGIFYSDSYDRIKEAISFADLDFKGCSNWLSVSPQIFMALCYKVTQNVAFYTLIQSFLFFFSSFLLIDTYVEGFSLLYIVLFSFCPIFYGFSVFLEMSVGCVTALNFLMLLFFNEWILAKLKEKRIVFKIGYYFVLFLLYFILFGYRQNALTVIPVILFLIFINYKKIKSIWVALMQTILIVTSVVFITFLPNILGFEKIYNSSSIGMAWETASMLNNMEDNSKYSDYFDYMGNGKTAEALKANEIRSACPMMAAVGWETFGDKTNARRIRNGYFNLIKQNPALFMRTKWEFIKRDLGIGYKLNDEEFNYNRFDRMHEFGMSDTHRRMQFYNSYHKILSKISIFTLKPINMFIVSLTFLLLAFRFLDKKAKYHLFIAYIFAVFYYSAFLITNESHEFRYFFPSFYLLTVVLFSSIIVLIRKLPVCIRHIKACLKETSRKILKKTVN